MQRLPVDPFLHKVTPKPLSLTPGLVSPPPDMSKVGTAQPPLWAGAPLDVQGQIAAMLASPPHEMQPTNANDAAKDFAAVLFGYMFSEMRPQEDDDGLLGGGDAEMFMNFLDEAIGKDLAKGSGNQLVNALVKELGTAAQPPSKPAK